MTREAFAKDKEQLWADIEEVRRQIADLLMEIDHIKLQANPRIEVDYAIKIGCYENELLQAQINARRAKRRYELAQARTSRGEEVNENEIEEVLDLEFEAWEVQLAVQVQDYLAKLESKAGSRALLPHEVNEIRSLHRELVKRLHPDLHPHQTDDERRLFAMVQEAYQQGDLGMLRSIEVATAYLVKEDDDGVGSLDELAAEYELQCAQLHVLQEQLDALKSTLPYTLAEKLADSDWVTRRTRELKKEIEEQQEARKAYDQKYKALKEARDV